MARGRTKKTDTAANLGFEAKLWAAADALRNNMDAAEYKHVVLGLIFLKYISDAFEAKHAEHIAAGKATTMGHMQRHHVSDARLAVPSAPLLSKLGSCFSPIVEGIWKRAVESRTLAALRDTLLPKLISGELRVKDAERFVAART
jgi:hypothetical protein